MRQIMNILQNYWRTPAHIRQVHDHSDNCFCEHALKIEHLIRQNKPLIFLLPAFPAKSPNREKTAGILPDLGERLALRQLNELCQQIHHVYPTGVEMKICSDGRVFSDLVQVADDDVDAYASGIRQMLHEEKLSYLTTYSLDDCYQHMTHENMREQLVKDYGDSMTLLRSRVKNHESHKLLFNGIHRFIFEDQVACFASASRNQVRNMTKQIAYRVIQRSNAWSYLLEKEFPEGIRLSIHPQACDSKKMGVMLLQSSDEWATPWHRVVMKMGDECQLIRKKEAEAMQAQVVTVNGQFSHYEVPNNLKQLVMQHKLVILRGLKVLSKESLISMAQEMGELLEWEFGNVMEMRVQEQPNNYLFTSSAVPFHWDGAFHREPRYLVFHCIEAPDKEAGGETLFTDTNLIWSDASEIEKKAWATYQLTYETEKLAHYGGKITVPLVQKHIDTGKTILRFAEPVLAPMLNPVKVTIQGADACFIEDMAKRCYLNKYCYTHEWQVNDVLIADNFALLHARRAFNKFTRRHLRRVQVL